MNNLQNLTHAKLNQEYIITDIVSDDQELVDFLFTLGCYKGEIITVISILSGNYVICLKEARYSINAQLAKAIII